MQNKMKTAANKWCICRGKECVFCLNEGGMCYCVNV